MMLIALPESMPFLQFSLPRATGYKPMVRFNNVKSPGGGSRIWTHGAVTLNGFQDRRLKPLGHPSSIFNMRPLKNVQFCSSTRKVKILTGGIYWIFRGLKSEPDAEIGQKGAFCKGLNINTMLIVPGQYLLSAQNQNKSWRNITSNIVVLW